MGDLNKEFPFSLRLKSEADMQLRDNAIEAARQTANRLLQKKIGKTGWKFKIRMFPHHILRENPLASGAGADRMSTGMKCSFGKPIGIAARIKKGQTVFQIDVNKQHIAVAKDALRRAGSKMPFGTTIETVSKAPKGVKKAPAVGSNPSEESPATSEAA